MVLAGLLKKDLDRKLNERSAKRLRKRLDKARKEGRAEGLAEVEAEVSPRSKRSGPPRPLPAPSGSRGCDEAQRKGDPFDEEPPWEANGASES